MPAQVRDRPQVASAAIGSGARDGSTMRAMTTDAALVLVFVPARGAQPLRIPVVKRITSIGSDATADIQLATAPARWAVVHRSDDGVDVHIASTGERRHLAPGEQIGRASCRERV